MVLSLVSWPALCRPTTTCGAETSKVVGGRAKAGHDAVRVDGRYVARHDAVGATAPAASSTSRKQAWTSHGINDFTLLQTVGSGDPILERSWPGSESSLQ